MNDDKIFKLLGYLSIRVVDMIPLYLVCAISQVTFLGKPYQV